MSPSSSGRRVPFVAAIGLLIGVIVVPFALWGPAIEAWVNAYVRQPHPPGLVAGVLAALLCADVLLPIPSSVVAVASGVALGPVAGSAANGVGLTAGCLLGYGLGRGVGRPGLRRFCDPPVIEALDRAFARHGVATVLMLRAVPVLAEASVLLAGSARMSLWRFGAASGLGNAIFAVVYATVGDLAADSGRYELAVIAALGVPGVALLLARRLRPADAGR